MSDYRVSIKVRNNRILKAIEESGGTIGQKWCEENGLSYASINLFVNMTLGPLDNELNLRAQAAKLCEVLGKIPDELWNKEQLIPLEKNFSELELNHSQVSALLENTEGSYTPCFIDYQQSKAQLSIDKALSTITKREENLIRLRFQDEKTLDECATIFGVSKERIRQIEAHVLRKLRMPDRAAPLKDALEDLTE
jgi:RNA polymerase sigma factor (sigma-70 family)